MAKKTISQRIALEGGDKIERQLREFGETGERAVVELQQAFAKLKGPGAAFFKSLDRASARIRQLGDQVKRTGERMRNIGAGFTVGASVPLTLYGKRALDAASDAEEAASAFNVLFQDSAADVRAWAATVAEEMGRGVQATQDHVATFMQLTSQIAPTHEAAIDLAKQLTRRAEDLASFYDVPVADAIQKIMSGLAGESEPLRRFGVFLNAAQIEAKALELGLGSATAAVGAFKRATGDGASGFKRVGEEGQRMNLLKESTDEATEAISAQEKALAAAQLVLEGTMQAHGDAARTSDSFANQTKGLSGELQDLDITMGQKLIPTAKSVVQWIRDAVAALRGLTPETQETIAVVGGIAAAFGPVLTSLGQAAIGAVALGWAFVKVGAAIKVAVAAIASVVVAVGAWPIALGLALGAALVLVVRRWDEIVAYVQGTAGRVAEAASGMWAGLTEGGSAIDGVIAKIEELRQAAIEKVRVELGFEAEEAPLAGVGDKLRDLNAKTLEWEESIKQAVLAFVQPEGSGIGDFLAGLNARTLEWEATIKGVVDGVVAHFRGNIESIKADWQAGWTAMGLVLKLHVALLKAAGTAIADGIADAFTGALGGVRDAIGDLVDWASEKLQSLLALIKRVTGGSRTGSSTSSGDSGGSFFGFAGGGQVRGPGSATSDSIVARLSDGEFVVRAKAVRHYGAQLFEMLNRMRLGRIEVPRFAAGGAVSFTNVVERFSGVMPPSLALAPAFAAGGPVAAGSAPYATLNLSIGGQTFSGLMAPRETAERLIRFATAEEVKSAGRRPGWYGSE